MIVRSIYRKLRRGSEVTQYLVLRIHVKLIQMVVLNLTVPRRRDFTQLRWCPETSTFHLQCRKCSPIFLHSTFASTGPTVLDPRKSFQIYARIGYLVPDRYRHMQLCHNAVTYSTQIRALFYTSEKRTSTGTVVLPVLQSSSRVFCSNAL